MRNLASRSAEAAREIKDIVELYYKKANEGKEIANSMIEGYKELNSNHFSNYEFNYRYSKLFKEQLLGIEQINDVVNNLDRQTQQNAQIASQTNEIAKLTDSIAKLIVDDTNSKEFYGKDSVKK